MIKICYIIGQLSRHGAERQLYELLSGINREKFSPILITLSQGGYWANEIRKLSIDVVELRREKHLEFNRLFKLIKLLKAIKPDIVHTSAYSANNYGRIAAIFTRVPVIISSERNSVDVGTYKTRNQIFIDKLLSAFTQGIICNSYNASEALVKKYSFNKRKVFTVHNGIKFVDIFNKINVNNQRKVSNKVVGTVARLYPQKNYKLFFDVAKIILDEYGEKNINFKIVGDGPLKDELIEYSEKIGIQNNVIFEGESDDIPNKLKGFDIFLMTSLYEGLSNAIMEAMLAGLPIVATDVGGNNEMIIDGETGFLCSLNDTNVLAKRVIGLINDEDKAKRMGENGKKRILNEFSIEKMMRETEDIYMKLLEKDSILKN